MLILFCKGGENMIDGRYLVCPYCNSKKVYKENTADNLKERMRERRCSRVIGKLLKKGKRTKYQV